MPSLSLLPLVLLLLSISLPVSSTSVCGPQPDFSSGSVTRHIPYNNLPNTDLAYDFSLDFTVSTSLTEGDYAISASMDTGSTGVAIGAKLLGLTLEDVQNSPPGYEILSGGTFWEGFWIPAEKVNLTFPSAGVTAQVPILAVTQRSTCHDVKDGVCRHAEIDPETMPAIRYLGVGFGRYTPSNPQATPDKVPFTNIVYIDSTPLDPSTLHTGYIISLTGITIGLTPTNTQNFSTTKLSLTPDSPSPNDWRGVSALIAVDSSPYNPGFALFDSGIHQSYIRLDAPTTAGLHTHTIIDSNISRTVLTDNSTVHVRIGSAPDFIAEYEVEVGDTGNLVRPYRGEFRPGGASVPGYVNTGRFFYRGWEVLVDVECGWFGLKELGTGDAGGGEVGGDGTGQDGVGGADDGDVGA